jgi:hypothetical protein
MDSWIVGLMIAEAGCGAPDSLLERHKRGAIFFMRE